MDLPASLDFHHIGQKIQKVREQKGLSQKELSALTGITQPSICFLESGQTQNPTIMTILKLMIALDMVSIDSLLFDREPTSKSDLEFLKIIKGLSEQERKDVLYLAKCMKDRKEEDKK